MTVTVLQPGAKGFDTASALTAAVLDAAKADGVSFVVKYVPYGTVRKPKMWSAAEVKLCFDRGLAVLAVWEIDGARALGGSIVGWSDGTRARAGMRPLGYPDDLFILTAADYDVYYKNSAPTLDYCKAFASTCGGGLAVYGDEDVADGLIGHNPIICLPNAWGWSRSLKASSAAGRLGAARLIPGVCIYQQSSGPRYGINVDPLIVTQPVHAWTKASQQPVVEVEPPAPPIVVTNPPALNASVEEDIVPAFIADSDTKGSALVSLCITKENVVSYRMAGIEGDVFQIATIDQQPPLARVHWPDATYLARAAAAYRG